MRERLPLPCTQPAFFVPGAATAGGSASGAGGGFGQPAVSLFQPAAAKADQPASPAAGESQQPPALPVLRTSSNAEATDEDKAATLQWASSEALLNAEDGAASLPPVAQVWSCATPVCHGAQRLLKIAGCVARVAAGAESSAVISRSPLFCFASPYEPPNCRRPARLPWGGPG